MKHLYLALAIAGAVIPYVFFVKFFGASGVSLGGFVEALFVNGAAAGFTADLLITSAVFWIWMASRRADGIGPRPWLFVLLNLSIGLSCALPAYLYWCERET
ncbi:MAG: DUF2834 domain-containing protein [Acidobacteriota bacterium]